MRGERQWLPQTTTVALRATLFFPSVFAYDVRLDGNSLNHRGLVPGLFSCQSSFKPDFVRALGGTS